MLYIPDDWIINSKNKERICKLLEVFQGDIVIPELRKARENNLVEIKSLGETVIYNKIINGEVCFN